MLRGNFQSNLVGLKYSKLKNIVLETKEKKLKLKKIPRIGYVLSCRGSCIFTIEKLVAFS